MENSQLKDLQEEVSEATKQYILTTFNSENENVLFADVKHNTLCAH